jgi:Flp pilus assembly pilin Flp
MLHVFPERPEEVKPLFLISLFEQLVARLESEERGQTMAEYAVVLAVITGLVIAAVTALSTGITAKLTEITGVL